MIETLIQEMDERFKDKVFLTIEDITQMLGCSPQIVYNWNKRANAKRRPPRIIIGKSIRFPKREFAKWLAEEQGCK